MTLGSERAVLREQYGFHFPYLTEQPSSFGVFKDLVAQEELTSSVNGAGDGEMNAAGSADSESSAAAV